MADRPAKPLGCCLAATHNDGLESMKMDTNTTPTKATKACEPELSSGSSPANPASVPTWAKLTEECEGYNLKPEDVTEDIIVRWGGEVRTRGAACLLRLICLGRVAVWLATMSRPDRPMLVKHLAELAGITTRYLHDGAVIARHLDTELDGEIPEDWMEMGPSGVRTLVHEAMQDDEADKNKPKNKPKLPKPKHVQNPELRRLADIERTSKTIKEMDTDGLPVPILALHEAARDTIAALHGAVKGSVEGESDGLGDQADTPTRAFYKIIEQWPLDGLALAAARGKSRAELRNLREDFKQFIDAKLSDVYSVLDQIEADERTHADALDESERDDNDTQAIDTAASEDDAGTEDSAAADDSDDGAAASSDTNHTAGINAVDYLTNNEDTVNNDVVNAMAILHGFGPSGAKSGQVAAKMGGAWTGPKVAKLIKAGGARKLPTGGTTRQAARWVHPDCVGKIQQDDDTADAA